MTLDQNLEQTLNRYLRGAPENLAEAIRYSLLSPGKRIRPRLTLACAEMLGLSQEVAQAAALSLEMIHCFTLIHDDLPCMDNDDLRRGRPTNHKVHGEALALLAGDALIPVAVEVLLEAKPPLPALKRLLDASGPRGVIGGQAAEMTLGPKSSLTDLRNMFAGKTGALFAAALLLPKDLAGIEDQSESGRALSTFADALGFAFQVADDLEDQLTGSAPPTHILHYLSRAEAQTLASTELTDASALLKKHWPERCTPLILIATEVQRKLHI